MESLIEYILIKYIFNDITNINKLLEKKITPSYFNDEGCKNLYSLIIDYYTKYKQPIIPQTIKEILETCPLNIKVKIAEALTLCENVELELEFPFVIDNLTKKYKERILTDYLERCNNLYKENDIEKAIDVLKEGLIKVDRLQQDIIEGDIRESTLFRLEEYNKRKKGEFRKRVFTGFPTLDNNIYGMEGGELFVIVGWSKSGKTSFMLNIGYNAWRKGANILIVSAEIPKDKYEFKFDVLHSELPSSMLFKGSLNPEQEEKYKKALEDIKNASNIFYVCDAPGCSTLAIQSKIRELNNIDLVIIDYLSLLTPNEKSRNLYEKTSNIAYELKQIARSCSVPILTAAQITREGKKEESYEMEFIAGSVDIPRHADAIIGLKRKKTKFEGYSNVIDIDGEIVGSRKGPTGIRFLLEANFNFMKIREKPFESRKE